MRKLHKCKITLYEIQNASQYSMFALMKCAHLGLWGWHGLIITLCFL